MASAESSISPIIDVYWVVEEAHIQGPSWIYQLQSRNESKLLIADCLVEAEMEYTYSRVSFLILVLVFLQV